MKISLLSIAAAMVAVATAAPLDKRAPPVTNGKVIVGYWVPWGGTTVSQVDFSKITHINYGFGVLLKSNADPATITFDPDYDGVPMQELVTRGHAANVQILMSIGGWTGSQTFSTVAASAALRTKFINNSLLFVKPNTATSGAAVNGYNMDGIDIDWEYPGREGAPCNIIAPNDSANYLLLLKELRASLDSTFPTAHKLLTAAVRVQPFDNANGSPMSNVATFAAVYDWINIMAYDIMGSWSDTTGPNAPFNNPNSANPFSFTQGANAWKNAGFPANKIVLGVPFYGRSTTALVNMNTQVPITQYVAMSPVTPRGGPLDSNEPNAMCSEGAVWGGQWTYNEIRNAILVSSPTTPVAGWTRYYDSNTQTPWLFKESDKTYLSYDDPASLSNKAAWALANGFRGLMYWDMTCDHSNELVNAIQGIFGGSTTTTTIVPTTTTTTVKPTTTTTTVVVTTTTTTTTTVKPTTTTTTPGGKCVGVQTWTASGVYVGGTKVQYQGNLYTAAWWTTNEVPGSTGQWGVWSAPIAC